MTRYPDSPYRVPYDGSFKVRKAPTDPPKEMMSKEENTQARLAAVERIAALQERLYANDHYGVLMVFQAMDAAGKDAAVRKVLSGVNPAGCVVHSFKAPTSEELDHDFLWRSTRHLPPRGVIGVFNRSYYEEVLVVRVHKGLLKSQRVPEELLGKGLWEGRFESIRELEQHLARNGWIILKFWLNVSYEEQGRRLLDRIKDPEKNWKFSSADVAQRANWSDYMDAYEDCLNRSSREYAPWYAIPADKKAFAQRVIAEILRDTLESLDLPYPVMSDAAHAEMVQMREVLEKG